MNINPQILPGHWKAGYALDLHTLSSTPKEWGSTKKVTKTELIDGKYVTVEKEIPQNITKWNTVYTPIGEEMYHLKYWKELYRAETIAKSAADFLQPKLKFWEIDLIIPVPPSDTTREFQPVYEIVEHLAALCGLHVDFEILRKLKPTSQLKEIDNPDERRTILEGAFSIEKDSLREKNVLLFDDLYRSGGTLNAVCDIITKEGGAKGVYVLTITKTRSKR
jgi:predicted amidophosphoribosyltransferase